MFYITPGYITAIILALPKALRKFQLTSSSVSFLCIFQFENVCYPKAKRSVFMIIITPACCPMHRPSSGSSAERRDPCRSPACAQTRAKQHTGWLPKRSPHCHPDKQNVFYNRKKTSKQNITCPLQYTKIYLINAATAAPSLGNKAVLMRIKYPPLPTGDCPLPVEIRRAKQTKHVSATISENNY